ncbi:hypothetical protein N7516_006758 [Penicillium verrucosum]|uniref:uncharacterized protein n=1 Tax=Penicillium verrucosum TaxID=60171 RepID=UPI002544E357|nr:uncharacterized protein N7516_006758 [Penicillium verrucosum]KAJ5932269.1 hypothetical protein N7516_006758 [Penicillium verrucosum]
MKMSLLNVSNELILLLPSQPRRNGGYTLGWAAINGSAPTMRHILKAGAPPAACGGEPWQLFALFVVEYT